MNLVLPCKKYEKGYYELVNSAIKNKDELLLIFISKIFLKYVLTFYPTLYIISLALRHNTSEN